MASKKPKVLVVDDNVALLEAVQLLLEMDGYDVVTACDGLAALERLPTSNPDLIIADVMMPRMDGFGLCEAVRKQAQWADVPFVFLSARGMRSDQHQGRALGADDYVVKPFDEEELLLIVRTRLQRVNQIRAQEENRLERYREELIRILGHELRTPLTYIVGGTEGLREAIEQLSAEDVQTYVGALTVGGERLTRLVENFLRFLEFEQPALLELLPPQPVSVALLIERAVVENSGLAEHENVVLRASAVPPDLKVLGQPEFLGDALSRLVHNAIKFTAIKKYTRQRQPDDVVEITVTCSDAEVRIAVRDTGIGIVQAEFDKLFRPFQQIERARWEQQGTGLGLAIAQRAVTTYGGSIEAHSQPGEGSTFTMHLRPA